MGLNFIRAVGVVCVGLLGAVNAQANTLEGGTWQCSREQAQESDLVEWTTYRFDGGGTIASQEWFRQSENNSVALEFLLNVDYQYFHNGDEYVLKPTKLSRELRADLYQIDPFNADARRDLMGYRIFFSPKFVDANHAVFEMRHHITPDQRFSLNCVRRA